MADYRQLIAGVIGLALIAETAPVGAASAVDLQSSLVAAAEQTKAAAFLDVQGCGISFSAATGVADRATNRAATVAMPLRLGSIGKLYTAAVIHRLVIRGVLDLDAPASRYLTAQDAIGVANRDATLRQLLNHTAGIFDYYSVADIEHWNWQKPLTPARVLLAIKGYAASGAPGAAYSYSNSGYHLVALAAENATKRSFADLVLAEIIAPLQLRNTRYNVFAPGGALHGYAGNNDRWKSAENTGPDSGVTATLADLRRYLRALFLEAGPTRAMGQAMTARPVETGKPRQQAGAGAELRTSAGGMHFVGHTGDVEGYLSFAYAAPDYGLTMVGHLTSSDNRAFATLLRNTAAIAETACRGAGPTK